MSGASLGGGPGPPKDVVVEEPPPVAEETLVLMPRDGRSMYVYWRMSSAGSSRSLASGRGAADSGWALRLYDVSTLHPLPVSEYSCNISDDDGYIEGLIPGHGYCAELGCYDETERWHPVLRSEDAEMPWEGPSPWVQDCFVTVPWGSALSCYLPPAELATAPAEVGIATAPRAESTHLPCVLPRKPLPGMHGLPVSSAVALSSEPHATTAEQRVAGESDAPAVWPRGSMLERLPRFARTEPPVLPFCVSSVQAAASRPFSG